MQVEPIVILGGGISGLAASLASGAPVFEAEDKAGGVAASDSDAGFTFDRGIHILQSTNARVLKLLGDSGVRLNSRSRQAYIHSHGTYTAYPFQVNTAGLPLPLRMRCVWSFLNRPRDADPRNYEEWMYANLGRGFAETFLIPYSEKFWTVHPRDLTHEWTGNRVPQPTTMQVLRGAFWSKQTRIGTNVDFRYPNNAPGYGAIGEALSGRVAALHRGYRATRLDANGRTVHFANGKSVSYRRLISTIPLPDLVAICPDAPAAVRDAAAMLRTNSILVVNLGIGRPGNNGWHWVHFPEKDVSFFRISFPHNFADNVTPPGTSSISAEVAYSPDHSLDRGSIVEKVIEDLKRVGILGRNDPIVHRGTRNIRYAYCIHDFQRKASVRAVRDWMLAHDVVPTGRYGLWNYFWSHEAIMSGLQAGEKALREMRGKVDVDENSVAAD
jgi:protoporphyrinogen oxidase